MVFLLQLLCLFISSLLTYFLKNYYFSLLKMLIDREYSFDRHTLFPKGNAVYDTEDSNLDVILLAVTGE
jgi:hypothetical protein